MSLESSLKEFGCSDVFMKICMKYEKNYEEGSDIEAFIEEVEEAHSKVEDAKFAAHEKKVGTSAQEMMGFEEEEDSELNEDY